MFHSLFLIKIHAKYFQQTQNLYYSCTEPNINKMSLISLLISKLSLISMALIVRNFAVFETGIFNYIFANYTKDILIYI